MRVRRTKNGYASSIHSEVRVGEGKEEGEWGSPGWDQVSNDRPEPSQGQVFRVATYVGLSTRPNACGSSYGGFEDGGGSRWLVVDD